MGFVILVAVSLLAAVPGGRIRNRPTSAVAGFAVAFSVFAVPWLAWGFRLVGGPHGEDFEDDLLAAVAWATVFGLPMGLLGACFALIANSVWYPMERRRNHN
jgi:hypothetical protein